MPEAHLMNCERPPWSTLCNMFVQKLNRSSYKAGGTCGSEQPAAGDSGVGAGSAARLAERLLLPRNSMRWDACARAVCFCAGVLTACNTALSQLALLLM